VRGGAQELWGPSNRDSGRRWTPPEAQDEKEKVTSLSCPLERTVQMKGDKAASPRAQVWRDGALRS
jgi:hypothetical protein